MFDNDGARLAAPFYKTVLFSFEEAGDGTAKINLLLRLITYTCIDGGHQELIDHLQGMLDKNPVLESSCELLKDAINWVESEKERVDKEEKD